MTPILYSFRRCPYAMRARLALILASKKCEGARLVKENQPVQIIK